MRGGGGGAGGGGRVGGEGGLLRGPGRTWMRDEASLRRVVVLSVEEALRARLR